MISFQCCSCSLPSSSPHFKFRFNFRPPPSPDLSHPKSLSSSLPFPLIKATKRSFLFLLLSLPFSALPATAESTNGDPFDPVTDLEKQASADVSRRVGKAVELLDMARNLQAKGDFPQALLFFTQVHNFIYYLSRLSRYHLPVKVLYLQFWWEGRFSVRHYLEHIYCIRETCALL